MNTDTEDVSCGRKPWPETHVATCFDPVWQRRTAAEDRRGRQWSKSTPTYLCFQFFMGQRWITKTCHHKISDFDWYLLHCRHPKALEHCWIFQATLMQNRFFFSLPTTGCAEKKSVVRVIRNHVCTHSKVMQWIPQWVQQGEHSTSVFYLSLLLHLPDKAAVTDAQNKTENTWFRENPTQWHRERKTKGFFSPPLQTFVRHCQSFAQILATLIFKLKKHSDGKNIWQRQHRFRGKKRPILCRSIKLFKVGWKISISYFYLPYFSPNLVVHFKKQR